MIAAHTLHESSELQPESAPASSAQRSRSRALRTGGLLATLLGLLIAGASVHAAPTAASKSEESQIENSTLVRALRAELARAGELQMGDSPAPYYTAYAVFETEQIELVAEFGGIVQDERQSQRLLRVDLRIGSPEFDSANTQSTGFFAAALTLDDDAFALRRQIWWTTDRAYKASIEALATKQADESTISIQERIPDFVPSAPTRTVRDTEVQLPEAARLRALAKSLSARMRGAEHVFEGGVRLRAVRIARTFLSSEGHFGYEPGLFLQWAVVARTQAEDGMNLVHYDTLVVRNESELPSEEELGARVDRVLDELRALRSAPVSPAYVGPVLFEGDAAPTLLRRLVIPHITGTPPRSGDGVREFEPAAIESGRSSVFARRVGKRVAPTWFSMYDDPNAQQGAPRSIPWAGTYAFDDEGVRPKRVEVIDQGRFVGFLMSRTPARGFLESTGHGRGALVSPRAQPGNVFVSSERRRSREQLYRAALKEARAAGESYAIVVRRIDDPSITQAYRGVDFQPESQDPLLYAVRIHADGREEPVRGLALVTENPRSLRDLLATGREAPAYGYFASDYDALTGGFWSSFPSYAVGASIHTPSLLFEEMELAPAPNLRTPPPSIPSPTGDPLTKKRAGLERVESATTPRAPALGE